MIKNERQYRITKAQSDKFRDAVEEMLKSGAQEGIDPILQMAQVDALKSQLSDLEEDIREYEALRAGKYDVFEIPSFDELPKGLIQARIALGFTQKDLADRLGIKEQQLQRYEATEYSSASMERMNEVIKALGVTVREDIFLPTVPVTFTNLFTTLRESGLTKEFILNRLIPQGITARLKDFDAEDKGLVLQTAARISRILKCPPSELFKSAPLAFGGRNLTSVRYKTRRKGNQQRLNAYTVYAIYLAHLTLDATRDLPAKPIPTDSTEFRTAVEKMFGSLTFETCLRYIWSLGVIILPLDDPGAFYGACIREGGRNAIVLKQKTASLDRWLNDLLHEIYHAGQEPDNENREVIESDEQESLVSEEEVDATLFASNVTLDDRAEEMAEQCVEAAHSSVEQLKSVVPIVARKNNVSTGALANYLAFRLSHDNITNWWGTASKLQDLGENPLRIARELFFEYANFDCLNEVDRSILQQALTESEEVTNGTE